MKAHDYESIESRVREARQLRSQAVGEIMAAAWRRIKDLASGVRQRAATQPQR